MKIRALPSFEGIRDNERNVYPKAGEVWEVSEERAEFLKSHGVIEFVEKEKPAFLEPTIVSFEEKKINKSNKKKKKK